MDLPVPSPDALAQPTRAQIFSLLVERRGPATTDEVAERFDLHPNGVRRHLERLVEGGFVVRDRVRQPHGRPKDSWKVSPEAHPGGRHPRAYADLAIWLAKAIEPTPARVREVEKSGRQIGAELAPKASGASVDALVDIFAALGFEPTASRDGNRLVCRLGNCPYRDSAEINPDIVCGLHRGITTGILDQLDSAARLTEFDPHSPREAGCLVEVISSPETS